ncbi:hypothetical protein GCM10022416_47440 [Actinomadura keratinilytica]|uniref:Uncharacterized protein n=1 Tax=Actinomadura keratinilytica TaxID=547461 RepID=A0ABP7Z9F0_9ACTN
MTVADPLTTRDTVARDTPARAATASSVGRLMPCPRLSPTSQGDGRGPSRHRTGPHGAGVAAGRAPGRRLRSGPPEKGDERGARPGPPTL